jgi:predicted Rossmann fold nucleotide-binding protein DprA/Smf involved in DNA uptake
MEEGIYLAGLHYVGISQKKLHQIFEKKENYKYVYDSLSLSFLKKYLFSNKQIEYILERKMKLKLDFIKNKLEKRKVKIVTIFSKKYPDLLKQISNPPFLFYLR